MNIAYGTSATRKSEQLKLELMQAKTARRSAREAYIAPTGRSWSTGTGRCTSTLPHASLTLTTPRFPASPFRHCYLRGAGFGSKVFSPARSTMIAIRSQVSHAFRVAVQ